MPLEFNYFLSSIFILYLSTRKVEELSNPIIEFQDQVLFEFAQMSYPDSCSEWFLLSYKSEITKFPYLLFV